VSENGGYPKLLFFDGGNDDKQRALCVAYVPTNPNGSKWIKIDQNGA